MIGRLFWSGGGGWLRSFRLCSHLVFLLGMAAEGAGYLAEERWGLRAPADRGCDVDDTVGKHGEILAKYIYVQILGSYN